MINKIAGTLLMILIFINMNSLVIHAKENPDEPDNLYARSAVLMDADSGRILFAKNGNDILPMASTTKIMTCILALEHMRDDQIAVVSRLATQQPKVHMGVREKERYYLEDLLYSLMLESHNDSAVIIAEAIAGSIEGFANLMNQKAKEIGCKNTYFITPNGLDAKDDIGIHSTTAEDLACIMRYCIKISSKKDEFLKITGKDTYRFKDIDEKREFICHNHNSLLQMMEGVFTGKTGYTNDAGYCYVGALKKGKRTFIVALLACGWPNNKGYKWKDTKKLMEYGLENYEYVNIPESDIHQIIKVENGMDLNNPLKKNVYTKLDVASNTNEKDVLIHKNESILYKYVFDHNVDAPVNKGESAGRIYYMIDEHIVYEKDLIISKTIIKRNIIAYLRYVFYLYCM